MNNKALAQNASYIITQSNDTIKCWKVKSDIFGFVEAKYKINPNDDFKSIKIDSIKEYMLTRDSSVHIAKVLDSGSKPEFVLLLERGKICLYAQYVYGRGHSKVTNWYISKNDKPLLGLKTNGLWSTGGSRDDRKAMLLNMFNDIQQVASDYKAQDSFNFGTIRQYVQQYNKAAALKIK